MQQTKGGRRLQPSHRRRPGRGRLILIPILLVLAAALAVGGLWLFRQPNGSPQQPSSAAPAGSGGVQSGGEQPEAGPETAPPDQSLPPEAQQPAAEETDPVQSRAEELLGEMSLRDKVFQLFIVTPEQLTGVPSPVTQTGDTSRQAIQANPVGGIIYFADNLQSRDQCQAMLSGLQEASPLGLFLSVDEEGGTVARLGSNPAMGTTDFGDMADIGASGDPEQAYQVGATIGGELLELGFNLDFAPVADVYSNPDNPVIGRRAFSSDPEVAAEMVAACVEGFGDSGILCTLKHFPGHGDTATDSHYGAARSDKTLEELECCEFLPFQAGIQAGAGLVMVGHISLPAVTGDDTPACLSRDIVTGLLRQQLGFEGLAVTDSLSMQAITDAYSPGETAVLALQAGMDLLLMPSDLEGAVDGVLAAVDSGALTEDRIDESVLRILSTKLEQGIISPAPTE